MLSLSAISGKYLKGFISLNGGRVEKTHDLIRLCRECQKFEKDFKIIESNCADLTDYSVDVRYPGFIQLDNMEVKNAFENAQNIKKFIQRFIS